MNPTCSDKRRFAAVCGRYCLACQAARDNCRGCAYELGRTDSGDCLIFQCAVVEHGIEHCGLCPEFPCALYLQIKNGRDREALIESLSRRHEIGTERWLDEQERRRSAPFCSEET